MNTSYPMGFCLLKKKMSMNSNYFASFQAQFPQYTVPQRVSRQYRPDYSEAYYGEQRDARYIPREGREDIREPTQYSTRPESRQQYSRDDARDQQQFTARPESRQYTPAEIREQQQQFAVRPETRPQYSREEARDPQQYSIRSQGQQYSRDNVREQPQYSVRPENRQQYSGSSTYTPQYRSQDGFVSLGYGSTGGQISFTSPLASTRSYTPQYESVGNY